MISTQKILVTAFLSVLLNSTFGQSLFFQRGEIWFQETFRVRKGNAFFHIDAAARSYDWFNDFDRFHVRTGGGYRISDQWKVFGMAGYFFTDANVKKIHDLRVNFDASYYTNIFNSRVEFHYRLRTAYRRIISAQSRENSWRLRNRLGILVPINESAIENNTWYFKFEDELFLELLELNPNFLSTNRIVTSFGWFLNPYISFELSYCWEMDFLLDDGLIFGNHIVWLKFNQTLVLSTAGKEKEKEL